MNFLIFTFLLAISNSAFSDPVMYGSGQSPYRVSLSKIMEYKGKVPKEFFEDLTPAMLSNNYKPIRALNIKNCAAPILHRIEFENKGETERFLMFANWSIEQYDVYSSYDGYRGSFGTKVRGTKIANSNSYYIPIDMKNGKTTVYIKTKCKDYYFPIFFVFPEDSRVKHSWYVDLCSISITIFAFLVGGFSLGAGITMKNRSLIGYAIYCFSTWLLNNLIYWVPTRFLGYNEFPMVQGVLFSSIALIFGLVLFFHGVFDFNSTRRRRNIAKVIYCYIAILTVNTIFTPNFYMLFALEAVLVPYATFIVLNEWRKGHPIAKIMLFTNTPFLIGAAVGVYSLVLSESSLSIHLLPFSFLFEMISFSLVLGFHIYLEQQSHEKVYEATQEYQVKYDFRKITSTIELPEHSEIKNKIQDTIDKEQDKWKFLYRYKNRTFLIIGGMKQETVKDMLTSSFLAGVLRSVIFFRSQIDDEALRAMLKNIVLRQQNSNEKVLVEIFDQ